MKKILLVSVLALGLSSTANAGGIGGFLKDAGDFFTGKNQYYKVPEGELLNTQWDKFKETDSESIYVRKVDKENHFSDGVWMKHIKKSGSPDEYKHYQTDCSGDNDVLRDAKIIVSKTDGTFERKKKDKVIKGDLKQDVRKLICSAPSGTVAPVASTSETVSEKVPKLVVGPLLKKLNESHDLCTFLLKTTSEEEIEPIADSCAYAADEIVYRVDDPKKRNILKEDISCKWTKNDEKRAKKGVNVNIPCQDALNLNGKTVYLTNLYKGDDGTSTYTSKDNIMFKVKVYEYQGYRITLMIRQGADEPEKGPPYLSSGVMVIEKGNYKEAINIVSQSPV